MEPRISSFDSAIVGTDPEYWVVKCARCKGTGTKDRDNRAPACTVCAGSGHVRIARSDESQFTMCRFCRGDGTRDRDGKDPPCPVCEGVGGYAVGLPVVPCAACASTGSRDRDGVLPLCDGCNGKGVKSVHEVPLHGAPTRESPSRRGPTALSKSKSSLGNHEHYDVALSFAGEDRSYAETLAERLRGSDLRIFYDEYEQASLWGKNLYSHLSEVYQHKARYCVVFLSRHYREKLWTRHELQSAQARAFSENREYILPVRLDDTEIPGILGTVAYVDMRRISVEKLFLLVLEKLRDSAR
jgi:hypothetical protein